MSKGAEDFQKGYDDLISSEKYSQYKGMLDYAIEYNLSFADALEECKSSKEIIDEYEEALEEYEKAKEEYEEAVKDALGNTEGLTEPEEPEKPDNYDVHAYQAYVYEEWDGGYDEESLKEAYLSLVDKVFFTYFSHVDFKYDTGNPDESKIEEYQLWLPVHGIHVEGDGTVSKPITDYLTESYDKVKQDYDDIMKLKAELDELLATKKVNEDVAKGIQEDLERLKEIENLIGVYSNINDYIKIIL